MSDLNICTFTGRLGADPEVKSFQNGGRICNLRMAVSETWKSKEGERKERTEWIAVTINSDGLIGIAERFLRKGSRIAVSGQWRTRKWTDQQGNDRYSTECVIPAFGGSLVMLDGKPADSGSTGGGGGWNTTPEQGAGRTAGSEYHDLADDIPFVTDGFHR